MNFNILSTEKEILKGDATTPTAEMSFMILKEVVGYTLRGGGVE